MLCPAFPAFVFQTVLCLARPHVSAGFFAAFMQRRQALPCSQSAATALWVLLSRTRLDVPASVRAFVTADSWVPDPHAAW